MNQHEWQTCTDPVKMLDWLANIGKLTDRKARLFAVACCGRIAPLLHDAVSAQAVAVAERYADGMATDAELTIACSAVSIGPRVDARTAVRNVASKDVGAVAGLTFRSAAYAAAMQQSLPGLRDELRAQAGLLLELFGNPFDSVLINPAWALWEGSWFVSKARAIYDERCFEDLPLLASALEEASCINAEMLSHLRSPGPHVRGCWALDLLLCKS